MKYHANLFATICEAALSLILLGAFVALVAGWH